MQRLARTLVRELTIGLVRASVMWGVLVLCGAPGGIGALAVAADAVLVNVWFAWTHPSIHEAP